MSVRGSVFLKHVQNSAPDLIGLKGEDQLRNESRFGDLQRSFGGYTERNLMESFSITAFLLRKKCGSLNSVEFLLRPNVFKIKLGHTSSTFACPRTERKESEANLARRSHQPM